VFSANSEGRGDLIRVYVVRPPDDFSKILSVSDRKGAQRFALRDPVCRSEILYLYAKGGGDRQHSLCPRRAVTLQALHGTDVNSGYLGEVLLGPPTLSAQVACPLTIPIFCPHDSKPPCLLCP